MSVMALKRMNSVCPDPVASLLNSVINNECISIRHLVRNDTNLLKHIYGQAYDIPSDIPILYVACRYHAQEVNTETIDVLVEEGADLLIDYNQKQAIHYAVLGQNPEILKTIIKHLFKNNNAKSDLINSTSNFNTALSLLIKEGKYGGNDKSNFLECVKILLENGLNPNITDKKDIPPIYFAAKKEYKELVELLVENGNLDIDTYTDRNKKSARDLINKLNIPLSTDTVYNPEYSLYTYLKRNDKDRFENLAERNGLTQPEQSEYTYLQFACEKRAIEIVEHLLSKDIDVNAVSTRNKSSPLLIAAKNGYVDIFKKLLNVKNIQIESDVLTEVLRKIDLEATQNTNYKECFNVLSKRPNLIGNCVNASDALGNFPLHYGSRYGGPEVTSFLLRLGASLADKNELGILNIADVDYNTLKEHFDGCINAEPVSNFEREKLKITFDYKNLLPTSEIIKQDESDDENLLKLSVLSQEMDAILYMSKSRELRPLLKHPLIISFLDMKWHKIQFLFYTNFLFSMIFFLSLALYYFLFYTKENGSYFFFSFLLITTVTLVIRETFQFCVGPKKYVRNFENYIEIGLIIVTILMLDFREATDKYKNQLSAIVLLLVAFECLFLIGNHPTTSTIIVMMRRVSLTFFKHLAFFSFLFIAFGICFFKLFHVKKEISVTNSTDTQESEESGDFFLNPVIAIFKTLVMLTGEFEAGEMKFDQYPGTSHVIFLSFVVSIAIILLNLLNGLAVSDTQEIRNEAELIANKARAEYISYTEHMLFNIGPSFFTQYLTCITGNKNKNRTINYFAHKVLLQTDILEDYKLSVYPYQDGLIELPPQGNVKRKSNIRLIKSTIKKSQSLIQEKQEKANEAEEKEKYKIMLQEINNTLNTIKTHFNIK